MRDTRTLVLPLDAPGADLATAGGKGASLSRLARAGIPVPAGFHVTTHAYRAFTAVGGLRENVLTLVRDTDLGDPSSADKAARRIGELFTAHPVPAPVAAEIRTAYERLGGGAAAVRSSATAEDLPGMSFAGQQDSFLNIRGDDAVLDAVRRCWASLWNGRAMAYRARHGIAPEDVSLAVVVQVLVPADAAGIMFTADPVSGARGRTVVNAGWGLGESVVGGAVTPDTVTVDTAAGRVVARRTAVKDVMTVRTGDSTAEVPVPAGQRTVAVLDDSAALDLARIGTRVEDLYGAPMDVEWAREGAAFSIVQARPITGLRDPAPTAASTAPKGIETWNDSLSGDFLWTNGNVGEAVPDVMTPCSWWLIRRFMAHGMPMSEVAGYELSGRIGGRFYLNLSVVWGLLNAIGKPMVRLGADAITQVFGRLPEGLDAPPLPVSRWALIGAVIPAAVALRRRVAHNMRLLPVFLTTSPQRCEDLRSRIARTERADLPALWDDTILPFFDQATHMLEAAGRSDNSSLVRVRVALRRLLGDNDADAVLTGLQGEAGQLASLGPITGLAKLAKGEIDRDTFARTYGHRGAHEFEVSLPRPGEDPDWIDRQLAAVPTAAHDTEALLTRQGEERAAAWSRLRANHPRQADRIARQVERWSRAARAREDTRSEVMRVFWVLRAFVQRAGAVTGHRDDLFFLDMDEILAVLRGDTAPLARVPSRRATHEHYASLPPLPSLIRGRFDPDTWAADPHRRGDVHDEHGRVAESGDTVTGFPGAAGVVEGTARVLAGVEDGDSLCSGEILVTTVTNIGWTPLFPRVAAVVTDIGAPLSHAAIVARELGIPAVVGCGNATMLIASGDRIRVDGLKGTVELLR